MLQGLHQGRALTLLLAVRPSAMDGVKVRFDDGTEGEIPLAEISLTRLTDTRDHAKNRRSG